MSMASSITTIAVGSSIRAAGKRGEIPIPVRPVVPKDIHMTILGMHLEPALFGREPTVGYGTHHKPALAEPECERFLFSAKAGVAFHANRHLLTIARPRADVARSAPKSHPSEPPFLAAHPSKRADNTLVVTTHEHCSAVERLDNALIRGEAIR